MIKNGWRELWSARRYDLGAFAVLTLFFLVFFRPALFSGKFYCTSDAFVYLYPLRTLGLIAPTPFARVVAYENNRLAIETSGETASVLVVRSLIRVG